MEDFVYLGTILTKYHTTLPCWHL